MTLCSPYWFQMSSLGHSKVFSACTESGDVEFPFTSHWLITNRNSFFIHYVLAFNFCSDHFTGELVYPRSRKCLLQIFTYIHYIYIYTYIFSHIYILYILCMWFEASFMDQVVQCLLLLLAGQLSIPLQPSSVRLWQRWRGRPLWQLPLQPQPRPGWHR